MTSSQWKKGTVKKKTNTSHTFSAFWPKSLDLNLTFPSGGWCGVGGRGGGRWWSKACVAVAFLLCLVLSGVNEHDNTVQRYCHVHSSQTRQDAASKQCVWSSFGDVNGTGLALPSLEATHDIAASTIRGGRDLHVSYPGNRHEVFVRNANPIA